MALNDGFNGTTLTIAGVSATGIKDISYSQSGAKVQVSGAEATQKEYLVGVPDIEVTITVVGMLAVDVGTTGATTITWSSSETADSITNSIVVSVDTSGSEDGEITTSVTVAPTPAAT